MPIYIDISPAVHAKAGLSRYADNLAQALMQEVPGRFAFFFNRSGDSNIPQWLDGHCSRSVHAGYKPWRMFVWMGQLLHLGFDRLVPDCELFHATEHLLLPLRRSPTVLTVHDLIFHLFPQHHKPLNRWYLNACVPLYCRRANAVICVSEHTKSDLVHAWRVDPAKVHVVYEAPDAVFQPTQPAQVAEVRRRYGLPERYLLTVGTIEPRKNLTRLVEALELLRLSGEDVRLVVVGSKGWLYQDFYDKLANSERRSAVLLTGFVPNADLPAIYAGAIATVLPSLYEGFGLPVLESMACGTPVVTSRAASLPEIGGEAALYFDPQDVREMAAALEQVWRNPELRHTMSHQGLTQAARFSWSRAAQETLRVYESIGVGIT